MEEIKLKMDDKGHGGFYLFENSEQLGEMEIEIADDNLSVYHTEVSPKAEGKGFAKKLLSNMVEYARSNNMKVLPFCPFVHAQFKRHPEEYADIWRRDAVEG